MKAFISCTFRKEEKKEIESTEYFIDLVKEVGLEPVMVDAEGGKRIPEQIQAELRKCVFVIGIFTKRNKIEGSNEWTTSPSIIFEMGVARSLGLPIAGFVQKGISRGELGLINLEAWSLPEFDPTTMYKPSERNRFIKYLRGLLPKIPALSGAYRMDRFGKLVEVFPNGYCIVTHRCRAIILDEKFRKINHFVHLDANASKEIKLPDFDTLTSTPPSAMWNLEPFLSFRVVDPKSAELIVEKVRILPAGECNEEQIDFNVTLDEAPEKDLVINYEWSLGCFGLFPTTKAGLAPGLRKKDLDHCRSSITLGHPGLSDLNFELMFYHPYKFDTPPFLTVYDNAGNPTYIGGSFDLQKGTIKDTFISAHVNVSPVAAGRVVAQWVPA